MHTEHLFKPFEIRFMKTNQCPMAEHRHSFFELVYIISGKGTQLINENKYSYTGNNLFLIKPGANHYFMIDEETDFMLLAFNDVYLTAQKSHGGHQLTDWTQKLEYIFQNSETSGCIIRNATDKPIVHAVITALQQEYQMEQPLQKELVLQLMNTLITVVARNISLHHAAPAAANSKTSANILQYIHQNIYEPEKLKAENIAAHFHLSQNYVSEYFKKHTQYTMQQYIINYKLQLAETRLLYSDMRLNEIAFELGFTDESHLIKTFKKYRGVSPSQLRKKLQAA